MRKHTLALALGLSAALLSAPVFADTATGNLIVKAKVVKSCTISSSVELGTGNALLNFGNITSTLSNIDVDTSAAGNSGLGVQCTNGTSYNVTADSGGHASGTQRRMLGPGGSDFLPYGLYSDAQHNFEFPTVAPGVPGTGDGTVKTVTIYGRIPSGTPLPTPGDYTDTVVLTVNY